jgi:glycosyltransferase involved in cell wall biosynthesis
MQILAVSPEPDLPESYLLRGFAQRGVKVHWMGNPKSGRAPLLCDSGISMTDFNPSSKVDPKSIHAIRKILDNGTFDLVHSFTGRALSNALFGSIGRSVRHVAYRGTMGHLSRWDPTSWLTFLNPRVTNICVSDAVRNYLLAQGVPSERAITIHKGHDLAWYDFKSRPTLASLGIPANAVVVGCVANMRPVKGVDLLLEAFLRLLPRKEIHLLLIGEVRDDLIASFLKGETYRENVHATGFRADAPALIGLCDLIVMPSRKREGLPKAVIEAMAQGVAPIVSNVGGMPEVVVDGECGLVVPPSDVDSLSKAILDLVDDREKAKRLGNKARERIRDHFNIEHTIAEHLSLYTSLLEGKLVSNG